MISPQDAHDARPMSRAQLLQHVLRSLQEASPDIAAAALLSEDGLVLASHLPPSLDESRVGGISATLLSLGARASHELRRGGLQEVVVRGEEGYVVMMQAPASTLLMCLSTKEARLGVLFFEMRRATERFANAL